MMKPPPAVALCLLLGGCAANAGTHPEDLSVAEHRKEAAKEEQLAKEHEIGADAQPTQTWGCGNATASESGSIGDVCWSAMAAVAQEHERQAAKHRQDAAKHRAVARALEEAEATECEGISPKDRDISPFFHREDFLSVKKVEDAQGLLGAVVVFGRVPGLTAQSLQKLVNCHMARAAAVGYNMPEMEYCPLVLKGVQASVTSADGGFAVKVTSKDRRVAAEIFRRVSGGAAPQPTGAQ